MATIKDNALNVKKCFRCGEIKPSTQFGRNKKNPDGLQYDCKECNAEYQRKFYHKDKARKLISKITNSLAVGVPYQLNQQEYDSIEQFNNTVPKHEQYDVPAECLAHLVDGTERIAIKIEQAPDALHNHPGRLGSSTFDRMVEQRSNGKVLFTKEQLHTVNQYRGLAGKVPIPVNHPNVNVTNLSSASDKPKGIRDYTDKELLTELRRRGYEGKLLAPRAEIDMEDI